MVRLRVRCRCISVAIILLHIFLGIWYFSQPLDLPRNYIVRQGDLAKGGQNILHLQDHPFAEYFAMSAGELCVREGTKVEDSSGGKCVCREGWKGRRCGVPEVVQGMGWMRKAELTKNLQLRRRAKRLVVVVPFTLEFDVFEANVVVLSDLVDAFVVGEVNRTKASPIPTVNGSNMVNHNGPYEYSKSGSPNHTSISPPLLDRLKNGWLKEYQHKIVYVPVLEENVKDDGSFLHTLVYFSLRLVSDLRPDDILFITTGEEILRRDIAVFLKLFHGYPMPIRCHYKQHLYGFYWQVAAKMNNTNHQHRFIKEATPQTGNNLNNRSALPEICAVSIHFFSNAYEYQVSQLQKGMISKESMSFLSNASEPYLDWTISDAGWRCHLCLTVQDIFHKFLNSPPSVRPKWFSESPSSMLPFIQRLIKFGQDETVEKVGVAVTPSIKSLPPYIGLHSQRFAHLTKNPYQTMSIHNLV